MHLYVSHPEFQFGPVAVVATAVVRLVGRGEAMMLARLLTAALAPVVLWTLENLARRERPPADQRRIRHLSLVAGMVLVPAWDLVAVRTVHIDDAIALAASVGALALARRDRPWWSAALVGVAMGAKPWAVAFLPILLLLRHHRTKAIVLAVAIGTVVWIPFLVAAPQTVEALRNFRLAVGTRPRLHLLGLAAAAAPVWLRPVQFIAMAAAATSAGRTRPLAGSDLRGDGHPHPARSRPPLLLPDRTRRRSRRLGPDLVRPEMAVVDPRLSRGTAVHQAHRRAAGHRRSDAPRTQRHDHRVCAGRLESPPRGYRDRGGQRRGRRVVVPWPQDEIAGYTAYRVAEAPTIDGRLDEPAWRRAPRSPRFRDLVSGAPTRYDTRAAVLWDDQRLYVGYWVEEPNVTATLTERDSPVYTDNDIELFVAGRDAYYELEVNAHGTIYEALFVWDDAYPESGCYGDDPGLAPDAPGLRPFDGVGFVHPRGGRRGFFGWDLPGLSAAVSSMAR